MTKWDIYIADVPFEDLPETKLRPVVVLEDSVILIDCLKMAGNRDTAFLGFFHQEVHDQRSVNTVCYTGRPVPCIPDIPFIQ